MSTTQPPPAPRTPKPWTPKRRTRTPRASNSGTSNSGAPDSRTSPSRTPGYRSRRGFPGASRLFAGAVPAVVPLVVMFPVAQRRIVRGVAVSGLK